MANFGSSLSWPLILLGLVFGGLGSPLVEIGILMFSLAVLFQLVTLPVEYNASARAVRLLDAQGILAGEKSTERGGTDLCGGSSDFDPTASPSHNSLWRKKQT